MRPFNIKPSDWNANGVQQTSPGQSAAATSRSVALGQRRCARSRPEGAKLTSHAAVPPFQGLNAAVGMNPGRRCAAIAAALCPGLICFTPLAYNAAVQVFTVAVALLFVGVATSSAQTAAIQKEVDKKLEKAASLEQMIQQALKNNPDIRLAEARLREALAERDRARADITAKVHVLLADIAAAEVAEKEAQQEFTRAVKLQEQGVVPEKFYHDARLALDKAKKVAAAKKAQLPVLAGTPVPDEKGAAPEKLVEAALKNHPDVAVSDAKAAVAEAELSRARSRATAEVTALEAEIQAARFQVTAAEASFERMKRLLASKAMSQEEYDAGVTALEKAKADLAIKEAKLPYLLGKQPSPSSVPAAVDETRKKLDRILETSAKATDEEFLRRATLDLHGRAPTAEETKSFLKLPEKDRRAKWIEQQSKAPVANAPTFYAAWSTTGHGCILCHQTTMPTNNSNWIDFLAQSFWHGDGNRYQHLYGSYVGNLNSRIAKEPASPLTEKLRKSLDAPVTLKDSEVNFAALFDLVRDVLPGVNVQVRAKGMKKTPIAYNFQNAIPAGAFLQFIEDEIDVVFVLREYGIVVVAAGEKLPPGAMRVIDFWKQGRVPEAKAKDAAK